MSSISTGHAKKLIQNYITNKIGTKIDASETRGVWFSRDELLTALNTPVLGIIPNGIRFYFGAYESFNPPHPPKHQQDENKITLVIIPTTHRLDEDGKVIMHPYRQNEILPYDLLEQPNAQPSYDKDLSAANDGQICPPPRTIV